MSKNIVLCLDGTWNGPDVKIDGRYTPTNVQKVFESLKGSAPLGPLDEEKEISFVAGLGLSQVAKYIHGVGDATSNALAGASEGAIGLGLVARIIRGYTYLSREYQPGDDIYIVGFSRGAYTARALAGLVVSQGLLDWTAMQLDAGSETSYGAGLAAWQQYKATLHAEKQNLLQGLATSITNLHDRFELGLHPAPPLIFMPKVNIRAVGVWETVGALGVPDITEEDGTPVRVDVFQFAGTSLSAQVAFGFHAIAADEQRVDFTPTLWDEREGVVQVIFPGVHADVGGGYGATASGLANCALAWMSRQLAGVGVLFEAMPAGKPDPLAIQHRPWVGDKVPYKTALRPLPPGLRLSQRVLQRVTAATVPLEALPGPPIVGPYRPNNLLNTYLTLNFSGAAPHVRIEP